MKYRVIKESLNQYWGYDFDNLEDAQSWVLQEKHLDENGDIPRIFYYTIIEVE